MKKNGFTLIELLMASTILVVLAAIAVPNFIRMQVRERESEVKSVAHSVKIAVEDFKAVPGQEGLKPSSVAQIITYLPTNVQSKTNPFNSAESYATGALVDGSPAAQGRVGYLYTDQSTPYRIVAEGKDIGPTHRFILTLVEGQ